MPVPKELKDVVKFVISLGNAVGRAYEDGKFDIADIAEFIEPLKNLYQAYVGIDQIDDELRSLTPDQFAELVEFIKTEFDIPQDKVEFFVEQALNVAKALFPIIREFI